MLEYLTLTDRVRRGINDSSITYIDTQVSTERDSNFVVLANDGYATIHPSGMIINGIVIDDSGYTVDKNLIRFDTLIAADSEVLVHYDMVQYTDEQLGDAIGDTIFSVIEPIFNTDFEFGVNIPASGYLHPETWTQQDVDKHLQALFVQGAILDTKGIQVSEASGDAIFIKDGDTVIDTASSSREAFRGYQPYIDKWNRLLTTVRINKFGGFVQY
jgi:hypothetical protein